MASDTRNVYFAAAANITQTFCFSNLPINPIKGDTLTCAVPETYYVANHQGVSYQWSVSEGGAITASDTSAVITWTDKGIHTIKVTPILDSCFGTPQTLTVKVVNPTKPVITLLNRSLESSADSGNQWYFNNTLIQGAIDSIYHATESGEYTLQVTQNGCSSILSDPFAFSSTNNLDSNVHIFPNPFSNTVKVVNDGLDPIQIQLFDMTGRRITSIDNISRDYEINTQLLSRGCYIALILDDVTNNKSRRLLVKL